MESPYLIKIIEQRTYNPRYGDDRICVCGHPYYRHFDSYEDNEPVGCKYCGCYTFKEVEFCHNMKQSEVYRNNFLERYAEAARILHNYHLDSVIDWLIDCERNTSRDAPYHNLFHTCCMIVNCYGMGKAQQLSSHELRDLVLAAAFHDFSHSAGYHDDDWNIATAIENLKSFFEHEYRRYTALMCDSAHYDGTSYYSSFRDLWNDKIFENAAETIRVTRYPFNVEPVTIQQKIIRDCDLMQMFEPAWFEHVIEGLIAEFANKGMNLSLEQMLVGQIEFLKNAKFYVLDDDGQPFAYTFKKANMDYLIGLVESKLKELNEQN